MPFPTKCWRRSPTVSASATPSQRPQRRRASTRDRYKQRRSLSIDGAAIDWATSEPMIDWAPTMRLAIEQATAVRTGDVPIGAVVVDEHGAVVAAGANAREATDDPTAHAEVLALRSAGAAVGAWRLRGLTLVVTLEPCTMCAGAAVLARVDRVVFGAHDPKAGAAGSLWDVVRDRRLNHRPEVVGGVLAAECGALLDDFFRARRARRLDRTAG